MRNFIILNFVLGILLSNSLSAAEPFYVIEKIEKLDTLRLFVDLKEVPKDFTGKAIQDVRENDYVNLVPLKQNSDYRNSIILDTSFQNSDKLQLVNGEVEVKEKLTDQDVCAIPNFNRKPSACLRYLVCKVGSSRNCGRQYAIVYQKEETAVPKDLLIHAGLSRITIAKPQGGVFELTSSSQRQVASSSFKVRSISSSHRAGHVFLTTDAAKSKGYGSDNRFYEISYDNTVDANGFRSLARETMQATNSGYKCKTFNRKDVSAPEKWLHFSTFHNGTLAIGADGNVYGWGQNNRRKLGRSTLTVGEIKCPINVGLLSAADMKYLDVGDGHGLGITSSGVLYSWGTDKAALGRPYDGRKPAYPREVVLSEKIIKAEAGTGFSVVLTEAGIVKTFGKNEGGVLGRLSSDTIGNVSFVDSMGTPNDPSDDYRADRIIKISADIANIMAIDDKGYVWIWGTEFKGASTSVHPLPKRVKLQNRIPFKVNFTTDDVYVGPNYQLIQASDKLYGWGNNQNGVLGGKVPVTGADFPTVIFE